MTTVRKVIGRLPIVIGAWDANYNEGQGYNKNNRVLIFNSELQSKIDNNTYAPAAQNAETGEITFDTEHWTLIHDGRATIGLDEKLSGKVARSEMGTANGVATLNASGKIPASQLPSFVDDIVEGYLDGMHFYNDISHTMIVTDETGVSTDQLTGKIYVDLSTNKSYRWGGTAYREIGNSLAIGTTSGTAADGGIVNSHINNTNNPHNVTATQIGAYTKIEVDAKIESISTKYLSNSTIGDYKHYIGSTLSDSVTGRVLLPGKHYEIDAVQTVDNTDYGLTFFLPIVADDGTPYLEGYDPQTDDEIHNVQEWFFTFNAASNANGITFHLGAKGSSIKVNNATIEAGKTYEVTIVYNKKRNEYYVVQFGFSES